MTREEAIDILKCDISADKQGIEYCHDEVGIEALDMAIKALEQEPSGEWIRRQDVIKVLTKNRVHFYDMVKITSELKELSSVNQEPSGDLISRQAVMDCFKKWQPYMATRIWDFEQELSKLPSVKQEPRWIPVSERLPEKNVWVLVTVEQSGIRYQEVMRRNNYLDAWTDNIYNYTDEITAWMPLSKPYEPQESEDKE